MSIRMARRLRIQYPGARYHVINRGNYRLDVFGTVGAAQAFRTAIAEASERHGWRLHAFVIMRNHYHLAVETPEPNLVDGMHWLQGTFATRFNRMRAERGHLFQGRYQALLVEDAAAMARVVDYIHLNPVRAGLVPPLECASFRWSSLPGLVRGNAPGWLTADDVRATLGFAQTAAGWSDYLRHLSLVAEAPDDHTQFSTGWAIGTAGWRRTIAEQYRHLALAPNVGAAEMQTMKEAVWAQSLNDFLQVAGKSHHDLERDPTAAPWKIQIAAKLRATAVPYRWIGSSLKMGTAGAIRGYVFRSEHRTA